MFTAEAIYDRIHAQPFVPLRIVASSGETYDIDHPELVIVATRYIEIGVPHKPGSFIAAHFHRVALMHITAVHEMPRPVTGTGNGAV